MKKAKSEKTTTEASVAAAAVSASASSETSSSRSETERLYDSILARGYGLEQCPDRHWRLVRYENVGYSVIWDNPQLPDAYDWDSAVRVVCDVILP